MIGKPQRICNDADWCTSSRRAGLNMLRFCQFSHCDPWNLQIHHRPPFVCMFHVGFLEDSGLTSPITRVYWSNTALRISSNLKSWPEMTRCWKKETLDFFVRGDFFELIVSMFVPLCKVVLEKKVGKRKGGDAVQSFLPTQHTSYTSYTQTILYMCFFKVGRLFEDVWCLPCSKSETTGGWAFERCNSISWWKH